MEIEGFDKVAVMEAVFSEGAKQFPSSPYLHIMWAIYGLVYGCEKADARRHIEKARASDPQFMVRCYFCGLAVDRVLY